MNDVWTLVGVELSVALAYGAAPLFTATVLFDIVSIDLVVREQFATYVLHASPSWLPTSLSTFQTVSLALRLVLHCPVSTDVTSDVVVVFLSPGQRQQLAAEVKTTTAVAQYSTSIAGPSAGGAVGRVAATRSLVLCSGTAIVEGMLSLPIDVCGDNLRADARGAILGNVVLWIAAGGLMTAVVAAYVRAARLPHF